MHLRADLFLKERGFAIVTSKGRRCRQRSTSRPPACTEFTRRADERWPRKPGHGTQSRPRSSPRYRSTRARRCVRVVWGTRTRSSKSLTVGFTTIRSTCSPCRVPDDLPRRSAPDHGRGERHAFGVRSAPQPVECDPAFGRVGTSWSRWHRSAGPGLWQRQTGCRRSLPYEG
jgi:hypothetical protein